MHLEKGRFIQWVRRGFLLRFHMGLILLAAFATGLVATKLLLGLNLNILWLRYLIAVSAAYVLFLFLIKLWLLYLGIRARGEQERQTLDLPVDLAQAVCDFGDVFSATSNGFEAGGGQFGGGGATGSWGGSETTDPLTNPIQGGGGGFSLDLDEGIVVILVAALLLSILLAAGYLIWAAPTILAEAAFEAVLASTLVRRARKIDSVGWIGSIVRATFWPFAVVVTLSMLVGWTAQNHCPGATTILDAISCEKPALD